MQETDRQIRRSNRFAHGPTAGLGTLLSHHPPVLGQWRTAHLFDIIAAIRLPFLERLDVNTQGINPLARSTAVRIVITAGLRKKQKHMHTPPQEATHKGADKDGKGVRGMGAREGG